ncbi:hypothetical protein WAF17_13620 [Bernardetia sp. ABR2-2B]|uniref:NADase-type glycan-binding domain-containing protein n=1 Tax=Bernardetia sp. ABR2-2B TaxID=3127472 RepID=UPI0030D2783B
MKSYSKTHFNTLLILFIVFSFSLFSCNNEKKDNTEPIDSIEMTETKTADTSSMQDSTVLVRSLYATSTELPRQEYSVYNAFDNNPSTSWQTMLGAALDEGIMFNVYDFYIKSIKIQQEEGEGFAKIKTVTIYINGKKKGEFDATESILIDETADAIYIRITKTSDTSTKTLENQTGKTNTFDRDKRVGINEIKFMSEKINQNILFSLPTLVNGEIKASSTLEPTFAYNTTHLFDARTDIAWAEGDANSGVGSKLTFDLEKTQKIDAIQIWNGYQRSEEHFKANARIKKFSFGTEGKMKDYELEDKMESQYVDFGEYLESSNFILEVKEVYEGTKYKDLVVSELLFRDDVRTVVIQTKETENQITELKNKAKNTPLENVLDRRLNYQEDDYYQIDKSFILRSDGTFVMYKTENSEAEGSKSEILADGNWEIKEINEDKVKIRVFGKFIDFSQYQDFYKGKVTKDFLQIFQDFVTIDNQKLKGEKFIGEFVH